MALTLNEFAKIAKKPVEKAIILDLLRQSPLLQMIPIDTVSAFQTKSTRWQTLPAAGTRKIGGAYTESTGFTEQVEDTLFAYGGDVSVDRLLLKADAVENPLALQAKMKIASIAARINYDFIANDHGTGDVDGFEGLAKRVSNQPARATIDLASSGDSLKVLASAATMNTFIDGLHAALHRVGVVATSGVGAGSPNVVAFMNENTLLKVASTLRQLGTSALKTTADIYDRVFTSYGPAKMVDVGLKSDQSTSIITDTEDPGDGGNDGTSIYVVRFGGISHKDASGQTTVMDDDGLRLIQLKGTSLSPYDLPEPAAGSAPLISQRIDWAIGLKQAGRYSVVRIKGFKMSAS